VVEAHGEKRNVSLPLVGNFQVSNALVAAALAIATGLDANAALDALGGLKGASGRLELVGTHPNGGRSLSITRTRRMLWPSAFRLFEPHIHGKLVVVFGAGGDRDPGKRPLMGEAAAQNADLLIVTDDNPRSEDPASIRRAVLGGRRMPGISAIVARLSTPP
jgi:UDP-N-acetylmuramoyl-L-alanyl-D-glutamate--2,6-diaminopimelate ligase